MVVTESIATRDRSVFYQRLAPIGTDINIVLERTEPVQVLMLLVVLVLLTNTTLYFVNYN